jgi:hypothetical protein
MPAPNRYTLAVTADWSTRDSASHDYFRKSPAGWFDFWTRGFQPSALAKPGAVSAVNYRRRLEESLAAESDLVDVPAIHQAILTAMKAGARYTANHKEGGSNIRYVGPHFLKVDEGDTVSTESSPGN